MTVDCPGFQGSSNPRVHGCERCGRVRLAHPASPAPAKSVRDPAFEEQALRIISRQSANPSIHAAVIARLDWGDRTFGTQFNDRGDDGIKEGTEEAVDGISWVMMHLMNRELEGDVREHLMRANAAFAEAHRELVAARSLL
jgi:hypothetical protein